MIQSGAKVLLLKLLLTYYLELEILIVSGRGKGELVSTILPQISIEGKPPKVTPWPSLFCQKPLWNKPNQVKNIMAPTISKFKPSLWEASSGSAGSVVGTTVAKKREEIGETELYKVSNNRSSPICSQASRAAARAGKEGAGDCAAGSPAPTAILSQHDTSDDDTGDEGANNDGINNEAADDNGLEDGLTNDEFGKGGAGACIDGAAYAGPKDEGANDKGIDDEAADDDGLYDGLDNGLANDESGERGAGARTNGTAYAGPKEDVEAAQADATIGRAKVDKATGGEVDEEGHAGNGGNRLRYGMAGLKAGGNGLGYGMAGLKAAMAMPGSTASCVAEHARASQATAEEVATEHMAYAVRLWMIRPVPLGGPLGRRQLFGPTWPCLMSRASSW
jgi:hypothetical protein